jgi:glutamate/tyrosine decarboxylase-like PLP-dependent enzyme
VINDREKIVHKYHGHYKAQQIKATYHEKNITKWNEIRDEVWPEFGEQSWRDLRYQNENPRLHLLRFQEDDLLPHSMLEISECLREHFCQKLRNVASSFKNYALW